MLEESDTPVLRTEVCRMRNCFDYIQSRKECDLFTSTKERKGIDRGSSHWERQVQRPTKYSPLIFHPECAGINFLRNIDVGLQKHMI
jgi:hypothetical protein